MEYLKEGDAAPQFSATNQKGEKVSEADFQGKKTILYFYPKDNTPGCTKEACDFRDNYEMLAKQGFQVIGVSADTEKSHQKFIDKYDLPFSLISDPEKTMLKAYQAWGPKKFMGREYDGIHRITYVIDEQGKIEKTISKVKTKEASKQVLEALA